MSDHQRPAAVEPAIERVSPTLSRRHLLAGSAAAVAATGLELPVSAQGEASPVDAVDLEAFRALCLTVTGADEITDDAGLEQLLALMAEDEQFATGIAELVAIGDGEIDTRALSMPALVTATNILQFWYLGNFRNEPVANRAERFPGLLAWQALPYVTTQTVCKTFGYWAIDPVLPDRG